MEFEVVSDNSGWFNVTNVTSDGMSSLLGRKYYKVNAHLIGFDDAFVEPIIVRAFYNPGEDNNFKKVLNQQEQIGAPPYVGYVQSMQILFAGMPIPPQILKGRLADRECYALDKDYEFIDFMGPADAKAREIPVPLYPFNATLVNGGLNQVVDFCFHPCPNGSLYTSIPLGEKNQRAAKQSSYASLVSEIAPGLITSEHIKNYLNSHNLLKWMPANNKIEPYRVALENLKNQPLPGGAVPPLQGLDESMVEARVIGEHVLLTLPDPENFGPTLCVTRRDSTILVYLLSAYDMDSIRANAGREALWRIREFQIENQKNVDMKVTPTLSGRGFSPLWGRPFQFGPEDYLLELKYHTFAVLWYEERQTVCWYFLSGIEWSVLFTWDEDSGLLEPSAIRAPRQMKSIGLLSILELYKKACRASNPGRIDISNFTLAAMRRDNFGAGRKLRFVNND